jgi:hypothetical protein
MLLMFLKRTSRLIYRYKPLTPTAHFLLLIRRSVAFAFAYHIRFADRQADQDQHYLYQSMMFSFNYFMSQDQNSEQLYHREVRNK